MKSKIIAFVVIVVIIIIAFICGQSYAKYITEVDGKGLAEVSVWSFKVNGNKEQTKQIKLASTYDNEKLIRNKIAPGTEGNFNIVVDATDSEVGIDYKIEIKDEKNKPQNLKFTYDEKTYNSISELGDILSGSIAANDTDKQRTIDIGWFWKYETGVGDEIIANDAIDTQDALNAENYTFTISVTGTQTNPNT